jgi:predicted O-methyltransferase YrrM
MKGVPLNEELYKYIVDTFAVEDDVLKSVVACTEKNEMPLIQISPENGKFLQLLIKIINAKNVLEIGTLAGYSTIWMARGLPDDGKLITLEFEQKHADAAKENFIKAGLDSKIEIITGPALDSLDKIKDGKFDFAFIDADKVSYPAYFDKVIGMMNKGGIITADNTLRKGGVIDPNIEDEGTRAIQVFNKKVASDPRVESLLVPISDGVTVCLVK